MNIIEKNGYLIAVKNEIFEIKDCVLALGNFDGVHLAHRKLLSEAVSLKNKIGASYVGAWSFGENPLAVLTKAPPPFIYSKEMKAECMLSLGLDFVILCDFSHFKDMSPDDFIKEHMVGELHAVGAVCGFNFSFGRFGLGKPSHLSAYFGKDAFIEVPEFKIEDKTVSSTAIRKMIIDGDVKEASLFLGSNFYIDTPVVHGKQLGRKLSFPTANQVFLQGSVTPKYGVYATRCVTSDGHEYIGVTNVGIRPTVENSIDDHSIVNAESYILDFDRDIYGESLKVEFIEFLREERKFESLSDLANAISADAKNAYLILKGVEN